MEKIIVIENITFLITTRKIETLSWEAEIKDVYKNSADPESKSFKAYGNTEDLAIEKLKEEINKVFLIKKEDITVKDICINLFRWTFGSRRWLKIIPRFLLLATLALLISIFFVDFKKGGLSTFKANLNFILVNQKSEKIEFSDTAFMTEEFLRKKLKKAESIFWASNVSFRTFQDRNKVDLEVFLDKKVELKLVLLDPDSYMGQDSIMQKFSRTARNQDIRRTINAFCAPQNGILTNHGDITKHQIYVSDYSPIIPLVRVDDSIYVSFPVHTDKNFRINNYNGPFLKFHINSKFGKLLSQHFNNMITTQGTKLIYPN